MVADQPLDGPATETVSVDDHHQVGGAQKLPQWPQGSKRTEKKRFLRIGDRDAGLLVSKGLTDIVAAMKEIHCDRLTTGPRQLFDRACGHGLTTHRHQRLGKKIGQGSKSSSLTGCQNYGSNVDILQEKTMSGGASGLSRR